MIDLAVRWQGSGPPLLLLHGLFGAGSNWGQVARHLAARWCVGSVDLRNHGTSPHADAMSYPTMAADVERLLDRADLPTAVVVGHSMGGKVAMELALTRPQRVAHLVIIDVAPVQYPHDYAGLIRALQEVDLGCATTREAVDAALAAVIPQSRLRQFLLTNLVPRGAALGWRLNLDALLEALPQLVGFPGEARARYEGPVDAIRGARSDYVTGAAEQALRRLFPQAELHTVADAGHWVHAENLPGFLQALEAALGPQGARV
jgi:pimeloyl-ACP methyl ester carboxylesterase